ncbi:MAG: EamA family transporter [Acidiferrobacteraceae bacterium]|nr:EamA family transporter [Acidiferrobacteraceae bacterium]MDP6434876.1 DMT family transporter [Arenicellales bacterium]MDP6673041.1 DMT family transporter [Arenicellales bacterium]MDP6724069.1 DMT family transporter [Arenicellales bacterium]
MRRESQSYLFAAAAILAWSTAASAFKLTLGRIDNGELLLWSSLVSVVALGTIIVVTHRWKEFSQWHLGDVGKSLGLGALNPFLYYLILFRAYELLPAQEAQPLNMVWPIVLVLLSIFILKQPLRWYSVIAMLTGFAGVMVISTRGDLLGFQLTDPAGVGFALGSSLIWALYWLFSARDARDPINRLFANFVSGLLIITLWMGLVGGIAIPSFKAAAGAVWIGLFEMGLAFVAWLYALRLATNTAQVGSVIFITPFLSLVFISLVVGEQIYESTLPGLMLIVAGVLSQQLGDRYCSNPPKQRRPG